MSGGGGTHAGSSHHQVPATSASASASTAPGGLSVLAVAASVLLCWVFYRVRMRQCEAVLQEMARALQDVRRTAEALQTRRRIVKAATLTTEKALTEYNAFLHMLHQMQEGHGSGLAGLPVLRHQIEVETMRAQVSLVQGCLLAMSEEVLDLGPEHTDTKEEDVLSSLHQQRKSYMHMSEELLTLLDKPSSVHGSSARSYKRP